MRLIYLIDFGSTYTKLTAVDIDKAEIAATAKAPTTITSGVMHGLNTALKDLERQLSGQKYEVVEKLASSSAAGGLRMSAIGLVPCITMQAATTALLSSGAKLASCFAYEMLEEDVQDLIESKPDIVLLTGGTDGGNQDTILHNAKMLRDSGLCVPIIMAGNRSARGEVRKLLEDGCKEVIVTENVLPKLDKLNIEPVREVVRNLFIERIIQAKGIDAATQYVEQILMPTPVAVLRAAKLIAGGTEEARGLGELMIVDIGGATTDVHSIATGLPQAATSIFLKGIPEPYDKRTVEGDLGVRYNAKTILEKVGVEIFAANIGIPVQRVLEWVDAISEDVERLAQRDDEKKIDEHLAYQACRLSAQRHAGYLESYFTPTGATFAQYGKDLTEISALIGTGGPLVHQKNAAARILNASLFDPREPERLRPKHPKIYLDSSYILYAIGLLSEKYPTLALRTAKQYLEPIDDETGRDLSWKN